MVRGELKVSWWVCYVVIRTLLMGFSSRFFFFFLFVLPPLFLSFCPLVVRFLMRRAVYLLIPVFRIRCIFAIEFLYVQRDGNG